MNLRGFFMRLACAIKAGRKRLIPVLVSAPLPRRNFVSSGTILLFIPAATLVIALTVPPCKVINLGRLIELPVLVKQVFACVYNK